MVIKFRFIYLVLLLTSITSHAFNLTSDEDHPFGIYYDDETPLIIKENVAQTEFLFEIPPKYYIYKDSLRAEIDDERIGVDLELQPSEVKYDPFLEKDVDVYHNQLSVVAKLKFPKDMVSEKVTGRIFYQGCSTSLCYRLMRQEFDIPLQVKVVPVAATVINQESLQNDNLGFFELLKQNDFTAILRRGLGTALAIAFLAGVITGFTPCVLPVIPLTLAFMGVSGRQKGWSKIISLLVFTAGMVLMYAFLGMGAAWLGKTFGFWFGSPVFQFVLIVFFFAMSLWMAGILNFSVPAGWQNKIVRYQPQGHWRQMYAGLTVGFLAAPCVGPVAGPLLVYVSASKDLFLGGLLMTAYALGLSVLFFLLGFFSRDWVQRFGTRSGIIKKILAILLLVTSIFYAAVFIKPFIAEAGRNDKFFLTSYAEAEKMAQQTQKGILIDFFADWCVPCREWDRHVWSDKKVRAAISSKFVPLKIDCTRETQECESAVKKFRVIGWPTILFLGKDLKEQTDKKIVGQVMDDKEFLEYLNGIIP